MCQSQAEGGKRCAAHTRPAYEAVMLKIKGATDAERVVLVHEGTQAILDHAATPAGAKELLADAALFAETFEVFPSKTGAQETARQELLAALRLFQVQAEIRSEIEEDARRRDRYSRTGTHAETPTQPEAVTVPSAQIEQPQFRVDTHFDSCSYCGATNVPGTTTTEGYKPLPHPMRLGSGTCVWGTRVDVATVENTSNLL